MIKIYLWYVRIVSCIQILPYKFLGLTVGKGLSIHGKLKIRNAGRIHVGKNFHIGKYCQLEGNIQIGDDSFINDFGMIKAGEQENGKITIGSDVMIGPRSYMQSGDHGFENGTLHRLSQKGISKPIIVGNNVWIGANVTILKGVTIGDNSVIGAGSVVTKSIPSDVVAVGNPCKVIRQM